MHWQKDMAEGEQEMTATISGHANKDTIKIRMP